MKTFAKLSKLEKQSFLKKASEISNKSETILEKDFWVCWVLERLFSISELKDHLTFKGGTSLSKVYGVIERFSEDIDISIEKEYLGFTGDKDPEKLGTKKRNEVLKELSEACKTFVRTELSESLRKKFSQNLLAPDDWKLEVDSDDPDEQTILFYYPESTPTKSEYIRPSVKIEVGASSEHWPVSQKQVQSYLKQTLPGSLKERTIEIKVLNIERTFWEKATILHMYAHFPSEKTVPIRQSRHYYDFFCLLKSPHKEASIKLIDLLERVAQHKAIYFRAGWANYDSARKGTLKLLPSENVLSEMADDYKKMSEMFFVDAPKWKQIIEEISAFEAEFNKI
ncbi:MAG: nucleotidyl transferase AbiEii/AbiGii toxin family protein [Pseudobdellovibrionaceae bacterium]